MSIYFAQALGRQGLPILEGHRASDGDGDTLEAKA